MFRTSVPRLAGGLLLAAVGGQTAAHAQLPTDYDKLDKIEDGWVNRNPVPIRPMVAMSSLSYCAVNPYLSVVVRIDSTTVPPAAPVFAEVQRFRTLPGPVAIARHEPQFGDAQLLVVCQHANALVIHDAVTGAILNVVKTKAQPADVLVDLEGHAWVSCPAADVVLEIDLADPLDPPTEYAIRSKSPTFLSMTADGKVLVAPRISGNGSVVQRKEDHVADGIDARDFDDFAGPLGIRDTLDPNVCAPGNGLPDEDLYWLDRTAGVARAIAKTTGTLLFANAVHPATGELWQLNIESNNKDRSRQSEHAIRGEIVFNRLTKFGLPTLDSSVTPVTPDPVDDVVVLDDASPGDSTVDYHYDKSLSVPGNPDHAIGTPYAMAFNEDGSACYVAGLLTDNVIVLDGGGNRVGTSVIDLPDGTMPRGVLVDPDETRLAIWGSGGDSDGQCSVFLRQLVSPFALQRVAIGADPTPANVRGGRAAFFDASLSRHNNASCASCHDEGKTDMLAWNLSDIDTKQDELAVDPIPVPDDDGVDNKGPMVTQTLVGISRAMPFHWRGEQRNGLSDFNAAFGALLGDVDLPVGTTPPTDPAGLDTTAGGQFDQFEAFVLSLTEDANQFQNETRILDNAIKPPGVTPALAVAGKTLFNSLCVTCHSLPAGSNNEVVDNSFSREPMPKRVWVKVAPFQGMQYKGMQPNVPVTFVEEPGTPLLYPISGSGLAHAGTVRSLVPFMMILASDQQGFSQAGRNSLASFVHQFDTGTAPATHRFVVMDSTDTAGDRAAFAAYLQSQASTTIRNCDVAVIGNENGGPTRGWAYNRANGKFRAESGPDKTLDDLEDFAEAGGRFVFVGMPVGTARKFAIDYDYDEVANLVEAPGDPHNSDTDGDGWWDNTEKKAGSDPSNPASIPSQHFIEVSPPVVTPTVPTFQWVTETTGRLTFETNELARSRLTLTRTDGQQTVVLHGTAKLQHNLLVDSLVAGMTYTAQLRLVDLARPTNGNVRNVTLANVTTAGARDTHGLIVVELAGTGPAIDGSGNRTFTATGSVRQRLASATGPSVDHHVVARAYVDGTPVTALLSGGVAGFDVEGEAFSSANGPFGPFVFGLANAAQDGDFTLQFTLAGLTGTEKVTVAIEAIGPVLAPVGSNPNVGGSPAGVGNRFGTNPVANFWSFPDTAAENRRFDW